MWTSYSFVSVKRITSFVRFFKWFVGLKTSLYINFLIAITCCHLNVFGQTQEDFSYENLTPVERKRADDFKNILESKGMSQVRLPGYPATVINPKLVPYIKMHVWFGKQDEGGTADYIFIILQAGKVYKKGNAENNFLEAVQKQGECIVVSIQDFGQGQRAIYKRVKLTTSNVATLKRYVLNFRHFRFNYLKDHNFLRFPYTYKFMPKDTNQHVRIQAIKATALKSSTRMLQETYDFVDFISENADCCCQSPPDFLSFEEEQLIEASKKSY